jgi:preprotein translocase subunit SecE
MHWGRHQSPSLIINLNGNNMQTLITHNEIQDTGGAKTVLSDALVFMRDNICPICQKHFFPEVTPLVENETDVKAAYFANLVIHYRDEHLNWFKKVKYGGGKELYGWYKGDRIEWQKVTESSKRQVIRKGKDVLIALGITSTTFGAFRYNDLKTIILAERLLDAHSNEPLQ